MVSAKVEPVRLPSESLAAGAFARADYADAFRVRLPGPGPHSVDTAVRVAFGAAPAWAVALTALRDLVARILGLKTVSAGRRPAAGPRVLRPGDQLGAFRVFARRGDELLLGEDDRHLDFRVSVLVEHGEVESWVVVSTVVRFNSWLGRLYFLPVRPLHRLIVPAIMRNGVRRYGAAIKTSDQ